VQNGNFNSLYAWTIQPGWSSMFPWLSGLASRFERYRFVSLTFTYKPVCPSTTDGMLVLAADLDADDIHNYDSSEAARMALLSSRFSSESNVWTPCTFSLPPDALRAVGERFIRPDLPTVETLEARFADLGFLYVGLYGVGNVAQWCGDLSVSYEVELMFPHMLAPVEAPGVRSGFRLAADVASSYYSQHIIPALINTAVNQVIGTLTALWVGMNMQPGIGVHDVAIPLVELVNEVDGAGNAVMAVAPTVDFNGALEVAVDMISTDPIPDQTTDRSVLVYADNAQGVSAASWITDYGHNVESWREPGPDWPDDEGTVYTATQYYSVPGYFSANRLYRILGQPAMIGPYAIALRFLGTTSAGSLVPHPELRSSAYPTPKLRASLRAKNINAPPTPTQKVVVPAYHSDCCSLRVTPGVSKPESAAHAL